MVAYAEDTPGFDVRMGSLQRLDIVRQGPRNGFGVIITKPRAELLLLVLGIGRIPFAT